MSDPLETRVNAPTPQELLADAAIGRSAEELLAEPLVAQFFDDAVRACQAMMREEPRERAAYWHDMIAALDLWRDVFAAYMTKGAISASMLAGQGSKPVQVSRFKWGKRAERV
jgi:hypothetical protein